MSILSSIQIEVEGKGYFYFRNRKWLDGFKFKYKLCRKNW